MASFRHNNTHMCSAVLITNKQLVTAAHCLRDFMIEETVPDFKEYKVVVRILDENSKRIHLEIEEVQIPSRFNPYKCIPALDIGVITVNIIFTFLYYETIRLFETNFDEIKQNFYRVSVVITVDAPVTAVSNKTNNIQCFKDIEC